VTTTDRDGVAPGEVQTAVDDALSRLLDEHPPARTDPVELWGAQFDLGLAWVHFPAGNGGMGAPPRFQRRVDERLRAAGVSEANRSRNVIGMGMGAPTVVAHGSDAQKLRYLRPLFTAEEIWCQLFSEPGAGSDVAGLSTMAVRDGDEWVVNGQKVWTSLAHFARWGMLVARTDADVPKHEGLTYFVIDMHQPGVEVRPLRQMTGDAEFNEVFFHDARVPDAERLGAVGEGWRVATTTLMNERVSIGGGAAARGSGPIGEVMKVWQARGSRDPVLRDRLVQLWVEAECARLTNLRAGANRTTGTPGPEGSTGKLAYAELNKRMWDLCVDLLGADGMLVAGYEPGAGGPIGFDGGRDPVKGFLRSRANSIEGGSSEIMRNILGERVLGLPGDVRVDKGIAWRDVPRN
jgi:alkylation response protein AidB-like acyl-CoA dehydrogenase